MEATMDIIELIEKDAKLTYQEEVEGKDVSKEREQLQKDYKDKPASMLDVEKAVTYIVSEFMNAMQPSRVANKARYDLLVRALKENRVLSKNVLDSLNKQLEAISGEEGKGK